MEQILVYMTFPEENTATRICRALLEQRLVACVNILPRVESMYWWEGEIQHETEVAALAKSGIMTSPNRGFGSTNGRNGFAPPARGPAPAGT